MTTFPPFSPSLLPDAAPPPFPPEEFARRRAAVFAAIGPGAFALLQGAAHERGFDLFRQTNDFHYLCGVEARQASLLLDGTRFTATLFLPPRSSGHDSEADYKAISGLDAVAEWEALSDYLAEATVVYTPHSPAEGAQACRDVLLLSARIIAADPWDAAPPREERFIDLLRERFPRVEVRDLTPILDSLRIVKSPREVELMRWAGGLCAKAVREAIQATRPGLREYHLGAVADYVYRLNGVSMPGYRAIIPSGTANIWDAHYYQNNGVLTEGDLVLMDYAPDVRNYTSDIGRMWPVSGSYSAAQRELYGFIVEYHKALLKRIRPDLLPREILAEAATEMQQVVETTRFSKTIYEEAARRALHFNGHLSHPVGMAVHDVGSYFDRPLEVGMVFAVDPQMWVPEEKLYIRVEDTVAVTENGVEVLTGSVPIELDEMEALVNSGR